MLPVVKEEGPVGFLDYTGKLALKPKGELAVLEPIQKKYDLLVFPGSFQPLHNGDRRIIEMALRMAEHVAVLCQAANRPRSSRNPWSVEERVEMVHAVFPDANLFVEGIDDSLYDEIAWAKGVTDQVEAARDWFGLPDHARIGLIGHFGRPAAHYRSLFPGWGVEEVAYPGELDAAAIRASLFRDSEAFNGAWCRELLPAAVAERLNEWCDLDGHRERCAREYRAIEKEKRKRAGSRRAKTLRDVTVQPVVIHKSGRVLLVKRGGGVGNGLLSLPGGGVQDKERLYDGCVRALVERTCIELAPPRQREARSSRGETECLTRYELSRSFRHAQVFDHPERSQLGRVITHAHLFLLDTPYLPAVKGSGDALEALWFPVKEIPSISPHLHDDHGDIIMALEKHLR